MSRAALTLSMALHVLLVFAAMAGLPDLWREPEPQPPAIRVELVSLIDEAAATPRPTPEPAPERSGTAEPAPVEPAEPAEPELAALLPPEPLELPELAPLPEPEPLARPEPPVAMPEPAPRQPVTAAAPLPADKPVPPASETALNQVESLLLDMETAQSLPPSQAPESQAPESQAPSFDEVAAALVQRSDRDDEAAAMVDDLIKSQIAKQWHIPAGAKDLAGVRVFVSMSLSPEGRVLKASVDRVEGEASEQVRQTLEETALRAVLYFRDRPFLGPAPGSLRHLAQQEAHIRP